MGNQIYDVYVLRTTGIPIFAGCTATDYCMARLSQHELHSAFLAAMYNFSKESFSETDIQLILFGDVKLNFIINSEGEYMMVFFHPSNHENPIIREQLRSSMDLFVSKYAPQIGEHEAGSDDQFEEFTQDLKKLEVLPSDKLMNMKDMQGMEEKKEGPRILRVLKFWKK